MPKPNLAVDELMSATIGLLLDQSDAKQPALLGWIVRRAFEANGEVVGGKFRLNGRFKRGLREHLDAVGGGWAVKQ